MPQCASEKTNAYYTAGHSALGKYIVEGPQFLPLMRGLNQIDASTDAVG